MPGRLEPGGEYFPARLYFEADMFQSEMGVLSTTRWNE
jgi:hypothetical protein